MKLKRFNDNLNESQSINEEIGEFGVVNINIDGEGWIKNRVVEDIRKSLKYLKGEKHLFVDGDEINPYSSGGGMG